MWFTMPIISAGLKKEDQNFCGKLGFPIRQSKSSGLHFPVTEVCCRYFKSAHYDDSIAIETQITSIGRATLNFDYRIFREGDGSTLATGSTKHACVEPGGRVVRIPGELAHLLAPSGFAKWSREA